MSQQNSTDEPTESAEENTFISHLLELRDRLLRVVLVMLVFFVIAMIFSNQIYSFFSSIVTSLTPHKLLVTDPLSPILLIIKIGFVTAFFFSMPYILYQIWGFIAPGLYKHERRLAVPLMASSIFLFYFGVAFARFIVLPLMFAFIFKWTPADAEVRPEIMIFMDRVLKLLFAFGFAFEVPVATFLVIWAGLTTPEKLIEKRPYIIVGAFVLAMILTPPDIYSQVFLAIPMWLLFELGIVIARIYTKKRKAEEDSEADDLDEDDADQPNTVKATESTSKSSVKTGAGGKQAGGVAAQSDTGNIEDSYPDDYKPLSDEELDAELDRFDKEMDELDKQDEEENKEKDEDDKDDKDRSP